jgi:hypothetical protein
MWVFPFHQQSGLKMTHRASSVSACAWENKMKNTPHLLAIAVSDASGGLASNPHCWAGGDPQGISLGLS